ncbi:hypothetical protein TorRG33x02_186410, partial [Trema orientale]
YIYSLSDSPFTHSTVPPSPCRLFKTQRPTFLSHFLTVPTISLLACSSPPAAAAPRDDKSPAASSDIQPPPAAPPETPNTFFFRCSPQQALGMGKISFPIDVWFRLRNIGFGLGKIGSNVSYLPTSSMAAAALKESLHSNPHLILTSHA